MKNLFPESFSPRNPWEKSEEDEEEEEEKKEEKEKGEEEEVVVVEEEEEEGGEEDHYQYADISSDSLVQMCMRSVRTPSLHLPAAR